MGQSIESRILTRPFLRKPLKVFISLYGHHFRILRRKKFIKVALSGVRSFFVLIPKKLVFFEKTLVLFKKSQNNRIFAIERAKLIYFGKKRPYALFLYVRSLRNFLTM